MRFPKITLIAVIVMSWLVCSGNSVRAERIYIDINQPFAKKIPIAIPDFQPIDPGGAGAAEVGLTLPKRLGDNLDMTGMLLPLDKRTFLESNPRAGVGQDADINFKEWLAVGAELLVKGGYRLTGNQLILELRLFDVFENDMKLGKRYTGGPGDGRRMINRFTNEIILFLTGEPGVFGTKIVFVGGSGGNKKIFLTEFGDEKAQQVSSGSGPCMMPAISKSGTVAYITRTGTTYQLVVGGQVVSSGALHVSPAFTPGGGVLAGISGPNDTNIFRISGGRATPVTKSFGINISPTVSPDGSRMAFVSDRSGNAQIYVSSVSGGPATRLTTGSENTDPSWSPKGDRIAFCSKSSNIFTINADGSDQRQLTDGSGRNTHPSWSPDGRMIVFSSTRLGRSQLFTMTANGERQQPLMPDLGISQRSPCWSPAPPDTGDGG